MNIVLNSEIGARFKFVTRNKDSLDINNESDWFENMVLDSGIARMTAGVWIDRCAVGTGNTPVAASQTGLASYLVSTTTNLDSTGGVVTTGTMYQWARRTWRFAAGTATGNLAEVGMGWSNTAMWNRALIKDQNGNPVVFPVLADEILDIVAEIRFYPQASYTGSVNYRDKLGNVISSHTVTGMPYLSSGSWYTNQLLLGFNYGAAAFAVYTGAMRSTTLVPEGTLSNSTSGTNTYATGSATSKNVFSLTSANNSHKSMLIRSNILSATTGQGSTSGYQFEITPAITKDAEKELTYTLTMTWSRRT